MDDGRHIEYRLLDISAIYCPINEKFDLSMQNHVQHRSRDQRSKFRKFNMADGS